MKPESPPDIPVSHATIDAAGRLCAADPAILVINDHAGGAIGAPFAVPSLATIVRLARRLGIVVSRRVRVADEDADLDLWVRAQPDGNDVRLSISGWRELRSAGGPIAAAESFEGLDGDLRWETDAALRLTFVSIAAGRRFGIDAMAALGKPLTALFALDEERDGAIPLLDAVARRRPVADQRATLKPVGLAMTLTASPKGEPTGSFAGLTGTARLAEAGAREAPLPALSSAFTTGLDRALRLPLARIIANADTINAATDGPVQQDYVDYAADIASAGRHLLGLVDDLVDLQGIEGVDFVPDMETIDLADVVRRAAGLLSVRASDAGVAIARPLPAVTAPARGDFRRTLQILVNLVGNAVRYSANGGVVTIHVLAEPGMTSAIVEDQGKGIAAEDQGRIFEKFERVDTSEPGGNGLGLYIARRLARAMGGDLSVVSEPGQGARFTLTLPVA